MLTKDEMRERLAALEGALEEARDILDAALEEEDEGAEEEGEEP